MAKIDVMVEICEMHASIDNSISPQVQIFITDVAKMGEMGEMSEMRASIAKYITPKVQSLTPGVGVWRYRSRWGSQCVLEPNLHEKENHHKSSTEKTTTHKITFRR